MLYRKMSKNGDELSVLGFGCMRLAGKNEIIDEARATRQLRLAIDRGVNYVDTAMPYHMGKSEPFVGRALGDGYRQRVKLATKLPPWRVKSRADMDRLLATQLERLRTGCIDYYLVHGLNRANWEKIKTQGVLEFLDQAKRDGRIVNAGYSFHGDKDVFKEIVDAYDWEFCQIQYNYLDEEVQAGTEGLKYAANKGLGVIVMEPLRGGNLAAKAPPAVQAIFDQAPIKRSLAEWGLRWVWDHPEVTVVLSGMNDEAHIEENLRIAGEALPNSLTAAELDLIERAKLAYQGLMKAACTGCRYCMPCPHGVEIPNCFDAYNNLGMFGDKFGSQLLYIMRAGASSKEGGFASRCQECGECEEACPQHLPIRELLKDVVREFEGPSFEAIQKMMKTVLVGDKSGKDGQRDKEPSR
jgi:uncharacterized protein